MLGVYQIYNATLAITTLLVLREKNLVNITDEEINTCRSYGINEIAEIAIAKYVSQENNVGIDKVLELKKSKMNWKAVKEELEANKNEK